MFLPLLPPNLHQKYTRANLLYVFGYLHKVYTGVTGVKYAARGPKPFGLTEGTVQPVG